MTQNLSVSDRQILCHSPKSPTFIEQANGYANYYENVTFWDMNTARIENSAVLDAVKKGLIEGVALDSTSKLEFCDETATGQKTSPTAFRMKDVGR
jgi:hypothetical protein